MSTLLQHTSSFQPFGLSEMDNAGLMSRMDSKFCCSIEKAKELLSAVTDVYKILEIEGVREHRYANIYYDTSDNEMYMSHHRGQRDRLKIRKRKYMDSGLCFLELKRKNNKGYTNKQRQEITHFVEDFSETEQEFLALNSPFRADQLFPVLHSGFERITLVNEHIGERCTIDTQMTFKTKSANQHLHDVVVIEVKSNQSLRTSQMASALRAAKHQPTGFSKYCVGRVLCDPDLKSNRFNPLIRSLAQLQPLET